MPVAGACLSYSCAQAIGRVVPVSYMDSRAGASTTVAAQLPRAPLRRRPYMVVGELPAAMAVPGGRGAAYWPVIQLIKDWNNQPESRELMLAGGLPEGTGAVAAAKIAAVVHALVIPQDGDLEG